MRMNDIYVDGKKFETPEELNDALATLIHTDLRLPILTNNETEENPFYISEEIHPEDDVAYEFMKDFLDMSNSIEKLYERNSEIKNFEGVIELTDKTKIKHEGNKPFLKIIIKNDEYQVDLKAYVKEDIETNYNIIVSRSKEEFKKEKEFNNIVESYFPNINNS